MNKQCFVCILTTRGKAVLYTGVTNDPSRRVYEHREKLVSGFTARYQVSKLVYHETFDEVTAAIAREKQIKAGSRARKVALIDGMNPQWRDLYEDLF